MSVILKRVNAEYTDLNDSDQFHERTHWGVRAPFQLASEKMDIVFTHMLIPITKIV